MTISEMSSHVPTHRLLCMSTPLNRWQDNLKAPHVKDFNPVIIVYRRPMFMTDHLMRIAGAGEFTHCELYIPEKKATFAIFAGGEMQCSTALPRFYQTRPHDFAWHMLILTDAENTLLEKWHVDMVEKRCNYNFRDLAWKIAPTLIQTACVSDLSQEKAHSPNTMFCSQAVILALREAFSGTETKTHLKSLATSINSRITTPTELAHHCVKHQHEAVKTSIVPQTFWDARDEFLSNTPYGFNRSEFQGLIDLEQNVKSR
jgi:hypothetical protein